MTEQPRPQLAPPPFLNEPVHYVAYGTPGGEYSSTCRAATVTAVGAWVAIDTNVINVEGTRRQVLEDWRPDAVALCVTNPTGLFLNERVQYHSGRSIEGSADPISGVFPGGTWHRSSDCADGRMGEIAVQPPASLANTGHGHVRPRADGMKARCGGPGFCSSCSREAAMLLASEGKRCQS